MKSHKTHYKNTVYTGYTPRPLQEIIHLDNTRFKVIVCHRRFGKTVMAVNELIDKALRFTKYKRGQFAYLAPTYVQAKRIAWEYIKEYTANLPGIIKNEAELSIEFHNGSKIFLAGANNYDSLRGLYLDGVIQDEYGLYPPGVFNEVLRPALADRLGWAWMMGTPAGKNEFYDKAEAAKKGKKGWKFFEFKASNTGYVDQAELQDAKLDMTEDEYNQEFECSFEASVRGSVFGKWIAQVYAEKRFTKVPYDPYLPVHTYWDLGSSKSVATNIIWFVQVYGAEIRFIDCYAGMGESFDEYAEMLKKKGYNYGNHYAPHDVNSPAMGTGKAVIEIAQEAGIMFKIIDKQSEADRIANARRNFHRCWFSEDKCEDALKALSQFREKWNDKLRIFMGPEHDWTSHFADAFGHALWEVPKTGSHNIGSSSNVGQTVGSMDWDVLG